MCTIYRIEGLPKRERMLQGRKVKRESAAMVYIECSVREIGGEYNNHQHCVLTAKLFIAAFPKPKFRHLKKKKKKYRKKKIIKHPS